MTCLLCDQKCPMWKDYINVPANAICYCAHCDVPSKAYNENQKCVGCFHYGVCQYASASSDATMCKQYVSSTRIGNMPVNLAILSNKLQDMRERVEKATDCIEKLLSCLEDYIEDYIDELETDDD